ncbi:Putative acinus, RNA recognition, RNA-binding domain superfamily, SAP domain superfamily [Septoria linicola]|uniref:Acinus, RNA recognition, RNA-binding domain superfamily, SAP domain superfamily n=1 Tax=Septoria linicola TaxID=215465 RepID=A0A9Q9EJT3_9PEZI|nr:putative acinus, RNA recognition, RNA-binding domain superfamily, SAP domain superfamily [Septoria linicola]USW52544.1 Putative acinus, RNA recognition, RNA-binding domain superfamily, SAP domain superfamily [Septoria linicola]
MSEYDKLKVQELKELVKDRGIAATGLKLKQHFVDALIANDSNGGAAEAEAAGGEGEATEEKSHGNGNGDVPDEAAGSDPESTNKRKRRSPTAPVSEETVNKKLKTAEGIEAVVEDAPASVDEEGAEKVQPYGSSDDVMQVDSESRQQQPASTTDHDETMHDPSAAPSKHSATRALYIRELVRPLQPSNLREHLREIASPPGATSASAAEIVELFHLDKLRTHALVVFDSISAASRARSALHDHIWPNEPMRKPLWVDFVPEENVQEWINTETERPDVKWEITYTNSDTDAPATATLQEAGTGRRESTSGGARPPASSQSQAPPTPQQEAPAQSKSFDTLDSRYRFTQCKPKIYYQPVPQELADSRQGALTGETSRDWEDKMSDPSLYGEGELRRYTFEDGDKLVDGGADFGLFGRKSTRGGRGGGEYRGGRSRGRGEYRGGGGGEYRGGGGDYYRGSSSGGRRPY